MISLKRPSKHVHTHKHTIHSRPKRQSKHAYTNLHTHTIISRPIRPSKHAFTDTHTIRSAADLFTYTHQFSEDAHVCALQANAVLQQLDELTKVAPALVVLGGLCRGGHDTQVNVSTHRNR